MFFCPKAANSETNFRDISLVIFTTDTRSQQGSVAPKAIKRLKLFRTFCLTIFEITLELSCDVIPFRSQQKR